MASINLASAPLTYGENGSAIALAGSNALSGLDGTTNFTGFTLTAELGGSSGQSADRLSIIPQGSISLDGRRILFNQAAIGEFRGGVGTEPLTIELAGTVSRAAVQALIQQIGYLNVSDALSSGSRSATLTLQKSGSETATGSRAIAITGINDAPIALQTITLYDGSRGNEADSDDAAPGGPWLFYQDTTRFIDGEADRQTSGGKTTLSSDNDAFAGLSNYDVIPRFFPPRITSDIVNDDFPSLDRNQGYTLSFDAKLISESVNPNSVDENQDGRNDHAGFNVLLLSSDSRGIELSFEADSIWADEDGTTQSDPSKEPDQSPRDNARTLFTQAESAAFNTTQLTQYDLTVKGDRYQLFANDQPVLSGKLRDYSTFAPDSFTVFGQTITPPNPYETPNLIFLGDNTPAAGATVEIASVEISTALPNSTIPANGPGGSNAQLRIEDADSDNAELTATIAATSGTLNVAENISGGLSNSQISGNGSSSVQLSGTQQQINRTLEANGLQYQGNANSLNVTLSEAEPPPIPTPPIPTIELPSLDQGLQTLGENRISLFQSGEDTTVADLRPLISDANWQIKAHGSITSTDSTDYAWHNQGTGQVLLWTDITLRQSGDAIAAAPQAKASVLPSVSDTSWSLIGSGNVGGDQRSELLWYQESSQTIIAWYVTDTGREKTVTIRPSSNIQSQLSGYQLLGAGDFDGNGTAEFLWLNGAGQTRLGFLNGDTITSLADSQTLGSGRTFMGIGDYNQDNRDDIAWQTGSTLEIWQMNGATVQETRTTPIV